MRDVQLSVPRSFQSSFYDVEARWIMQRGACHNDSSGRQPHRASTAGCRSVPWDTTDGPRRQQLYRLGQDSPGAFLIVSRVCAFNRHSDQSPANIIISFTRTDCPSACIKSLVVTRELSSHTELLQQQQQQQLRQFIRRHSLLHQSIFRPVIKLLAL